MMRNKLFNLFLIILFISFTYQQDEIPMFPSDFLWGTATSSYQIEVILNLIVRELIMLMEEI